MLHLIILKLVTSLNYRFLSQKLMKMVQTMKIKYMLVNKTGKARKIPPFEAWQWTRHVEDENQLKSILQGLKKTIRDNRLTLANLYVEPAAALEELYRTSMPFYKGPIIYDETLLPSRIINRNEETLDTLFDEDTSYSNESGKANPVNMTLLQARRLASPWGMLQKA